MKNDIIVTVLMTVYNGAKFLREAIDSILKQTFTDFEFIIVNDASTDSSKSIIESYKDERIILINNDKNLGVAKSSNIGLKIAKGKYIARMDSDDISLTHRFEKQVNFMEKNKEVGICGSWIRTIGVDEKSRNVWKYPIDDASIRSNHVFGPQLAHPSVIMRRELLKKHNINYNPDFTRALDYELWVKSSEFVTFANIDEVLLLYRMHSNQISKKHFEEQQYLAGKVRLEELKRLGINLNKEDYNLHQTISINKIKPTLSCLKKVENWLLKLKKANMEALYYPNKEFNEVIFSKWCTLCDLGLKYNNDIIDIFYKSSLVNQIQLPEKQIDKQKLIKYIQINNLNKIAIFGTSRMAHYLFKILKDNRYSVVIFLDGNIKSKKTINNVNVVNPNWLKLENNCQQIDVIISSILGEHDQNVINRLNKMTSNQIDIITWKNFT